MAINIPIVTEFVDAGLKSASGAFDNFRTKVGEAEGGLGKLKAGAGAAFDGIKANAGAMALGAGAAIAGFAVKAIGEFNDLALAAGKFSDATGLSAEESSRWMEVAGDVGVSSETVQKSIDKMNKAIATSTPEWKALGAQVEYTSAGTIDVNKTFLNTIDALNKIQDPAQRAELAAKTLGKGWQDMAELIAMGSDDLTASLESVSDQKVIDDAEVEKARDFRAALDNLADKGQDLALVLGEALVPILTQIVEVATAVSDAIGKVGDVFGVVTDFMSGDGLESMVANIKAQEELNGALKDQWVAYSEARIRAEELADANDDLTVSLEDVDYALQELKGNIDERQAWRNLQDTLADVEDAARRAFEEGTPEALRASEEALDSARLKVAGYIAEIDTIPPDRKTDFIARLDQANLDEVERILAYLARPRSMGIIVGVGETPSEVRGVAPRMATLGLGAGSPNVTVNVAGSVVAENDLVESVRKGLVNSQRNGSQLVYTNK